MKKLTKTKKNLVEAFLKEEIASIAHMYMKEFGDVKDELLGSARNISEVQKAYDEAISSAKKKVLANLDEFFADYEEHTY